MERIKFQTEQFGGPEVALKYLARYTHRVAISDRRLISIEDGKVRFPYKDYAQGGQQREMPLDTLEFTRRFLLHVLPKGFVRIPYYGFLANCRRGCIENARRSRLPGFPPVAARWLGMPISRHRRRGHRGVADRSPRSRAVGPPILGLALLHSVR